MPQWLTVADCKAVLQSLLGAELSAYRGVAADWQENPDIDSLERLHLAGCVNEFFRLHETGVEDRLLMTSSIDDWASLVAQATMETSGLTFRTSGSTGQPTAHLHPWNQIAAEAKALELCLADVLSIQRVLSWLPLHHLYGFMLGIALPAVGQIPRLWVNSHALPEITSGDLVVTVPPRWDYLARSGKSWPPQVVGVTSTAPLSEATADHLLELGLTGLLDIYGSTETGGVATRWRPDPTYQLLTHWLRSDHLHIQRKGDTVTIPLLDKAHWLSDRTFHLNGRIDDVVSIGGVNVSPGLITERLLALNSVDGCTVRPIKAASQTRLKAFIVPTASEAITSDEIAKTISQWPAAERPISFTYGAVLPTNTMGKLTDW